MEKTLKLKVRQHHTIHQLLMELVDFGYGSTSLTTSNSGIQPGQFQHLGGDLKIFPTNSLEPVRLSFFGNEIDKISTIDKTSGQKLADFETVQIESNFLKLEGSNILPSNYIVHIDHGIGIFSHKETIKVDDEIIHYAVINYLNEDVLRVPASQIDKLSRYIGVGKKRPRLNKLGTITWKKTYHKTYEDVIKLARDLLDVFAARKVANKKPLIFNKSWESEIVKTFGFVETSDQTQAISETYNDQQKITPMDRLICGDVGFGKTEVAIRALTQAAANGYQSAILVPTTILCEQHFLTLQKRFAALPVRIARLSRFNTQSETTSVLQDIKDGKVDILVATHKVLHSDISFKNLGLLVIDEEQKFGVKDKEKLKKFKTSVDVLVLTATPIPRTLFMALSGLRDISRLYSAPAGRKSIETKIIKYDEDTIKRIILAETTRSGQVYYLHNQVSTIGGTERKLQKLLPDLVIKTAHGQMTESGLLGAMSDFTAGKIDVLVCSTIIENGLDLSNVNTLIVEESDRFGLSQLYQIRGRIGRSKRKAHALFTYKTKNLSENATKRLKSMADNTRLGTGYDIALQDLEIRGGGNILGRDQHGNMEAVGLVLYSKLLKIAVDKIKNL